MVNEGASSVNVFEGYLSQPSDLRGKETGYFAVVSILEAIFLVTMAHNLGYNRLLHSHAVVPESKSKRAGTLPI